VDIRFVGQEHTLTVPIPTRAGAVDVDPGPVAERFLDEYERAFGAVLDEEIEIVCVRSIATAPLERDAVPAANGDGRAAGGRRSTVQAWSFTGGELAEFAVVDRAGLRSDADLHGPAIVREQTATTYVDRGFSATVHAGGALLIERRGSP
jgi:N-methylhydantoinase A